MANDLKQELLILQKIAQQIIEMGGKIYFVGGFVRDLFTGKENKDIDVEVYGLTSTQLKKILSQFGVVDEVGASFGIYMIHGVAIDFALPRREVQGKVKDKEQVITLPKIYEERVMNEMKQKYPHYTVQIDNTQLYGHKDFIVIPDAFMTLKEATIRRDFTMNALMKDVVTGEVIDLWNGQQAIEQGVIRHIDDQTFIEDPLRVLRACQFASRFEFDIDQDTQKLCKQIDLSSLAQERIFEEMKKALMKSKKPSIALEFMRELLVIQKLFPELQALIDCMQDATHHKEGTVWNHTNLVLNIGATLKEKASHPIVFMFGLLCHDIGKPDTTQEENGKITSHRHEIVGEQVAKTFMKRITNDKKIIDGVKHITRNHMRLLSLYPNGSDKAIRKLSRDTNIQDMRLVAEADYRGRGLEEREFTPIADWFDTRTKEIGADKAFKSLVTGNDLIALGLKPGEQFGILLEKAINFQLEGLEKEEILSQLLNYSNLK